MSGTASTTQLNLSTPTSGVGLWGSRAFMPYRREPQDEWVRSSHHPLLDRVYELDAAAAIDDALDAVFEQFDDLFVTDRFDVCDNILAALDPARVDVAITVGVLTATLPARGRLDRREAFVRSVEAYLQRTRAPEEVEGLLRGLR